MEKALTVNKVGGVNMSQLDEVLNLVQILKGKGENPILVVSAFSGVTNSLLKVLDDLDGTDYAEDSIRAAFGEVLEIVNGRIDKFIEGEKYKAQAQDHVKREVDICVNALMTHKDVAQTLAPGEKTYGIRDQIIAFGERSVIGVLEAYLNKNNVSSKAINDVEYKGNGKKSKGQISKIELHRGIQKGLAEAIEPHIDDVDKEVLIIGGHVKDVLRGMIPEIGRSYTDTTAVDLTLALNRILGVAVDKTVTWKGEEIDGVLSADPDQLDKRVHPDQPDKRVNEPVLHHDVSLNEGMELAEAGAKIMQLDALNLAYMEKLPLSIGNIKKPHEEGTTFSAGESISEYPFKIVMSNKNVDIISFETVAPGFKILLAEKLKENGVDVNDILSAGKSVSYTVNLPPEENKADLKELRRRIRSALAKIRELEVNGEVYACSSTWNKDKASVVIIGDELKGQAGVLSVISGVLAAERINVDGIEHDLGQRKISIYVDKKKALRAVQVLHRVFIDKDKVYAEEVRERIGEVITSFLT